MANQFSLKPALGTAFETAGALGQLGAIRQARKDATAKAETETRQLGQRQAALGLGGETPEQQQTANLQLLSEDQKAAAQFFKTFSEMGTRERAEAKESNAMTSKAAASILNLPDENLKAGLMAHATQLLKSGFKEEAQRIKEAAEENIPLEELRLDLQAMASQSRDIEKIIETGEKKAKRQAAETLATTEKDIKNTKTDFERIDKLRSRVDSVSKTFKTVRAAKSRVDAVFDLDDAAIEAFTEQAKINNPKLASIKGNVQAFGDMALIFNWMKMLDPGSTVREGEFASAQNTAGVADQVMNLYNKALSGTRLTPEQRQGIKANVETQYASAVKNNEDDLKKFRLTAEKFNLDELQIFDQPSSTGQKVGRFTIETEE